MNFLVMQTCKYRSNKLGRKDFVPLLETCDLSISTDNKQKPCLCPFLLCVSKQSTVLYEWLCINVFRASGLSLKEKTFASSLSSSPCPYMTFSLLFFHSSLQQTAKTAA
jgi:hypothetical protein